MGHDISRLIVSISPNVLKVCWVFQHEHIKSPMSNLISFEWEHVHLVYFVASTVLLCIRLSTQCQIIICRLARSIKTPVQLQFRLTQSSLFQSTFEDSRDTNLLLGPLGNKHAQELHTHRHAILLLQDLSWHAKRLWHGWAMSRLHRMLKAACGLECCQPQQWLFVYTVNCRNSASLREQAFL